MSVRHLFIEIFGPSSQCGDQQLQWTPGIPGTSEYIWPTCGSTWICSNEGWNTKSGHRRGLLYSMHRYPRVQLVEAGQATTKTLMGEFVTFSPGVRAFEWKCKRLFGPYKHYGAGGASFLHFANLFLRRHIVENLFSNTLNPKALTDIILLSCDVAI